MTRLSCLILSIALVAPTLAAPMSNKLLSTSDLLQNGHEAQMLNAQFATASPSDSCNGTENACIDGQFAQCSSGAWVLTDCPGNLQCFALPLVNKKGTTITCDSKSDAAARIKQTGAKGG
ncbi:hypothetical protein BD410DRAFT_729718, partial [Rickenella mellea]